MSRENGRPDESLNVQVIYHDSGYQEALGFLRTDQRLLAEFYTDETVSPECIVEWTDGDVVLERRGYELEDLLS